MDLEATRRQLNQDPVSSDEKKQDTKPIETLYIAGRPLKVRAPGNQTTTSTGFQQPRLWDKHKRATLDAETRQIFQEKATRYVLPKHNKLQIKTITGQPGEADAELKTVHNLRAQLATLREHLYQHDLDDVFTIIKPVDVANTSALADGSYDLLRDFGHLDPSQVALSSMWYNTWIDEPFIPENMAFSQQFLKNNTDESLWQRCLEESLQYPPSH